MGSAHTVLAVCWSRVFNNTEKNLHAFQKSTWGGYIDYELIQNNTRVLLWESSITVMQGQLLLQQDQLNLLNNKVNRFT